MSIVSAGRTTWFLLTRAERRQAVVLLSLMLTGMSFEVLGIGLIIPAVALLSVPGAGATFPAAKKLVDVIGGQGGHVPLLAGMLILVAVYAMKAMLLAYLARRQSRFAFSVGARLSQDLFATYLMQPYAFHLQRNSAQLIRNATNSVDAFTSGGLISGMMFATEGLVLFGICVALLIIEPLGALAAFAGFGAVGWGLHTLARGRIQLAGAAAEYHDGLRVQHLQQGLGGAKEAKLLGREAEFLRRYDTHTLESARAGELYHTLQQFPRIILELFAVLMMAGLVAALVAQGRAPASIAVTLALFAAAAVRLIPSVNRLLAAVQGLAYSAAVTETLSAELGLRKPIERESVAVRLPFAEAVMVRDVSYTYPGASVPALNGVSVTMAPHESIGFIGPSGAGKSTLVDILLGLLTPDEGEVSVDGYDIQRSLRGWQEQIGYVPQSILLTDDTLRCNVAFGIAPERIDDRSLWRALEAAQLADFVKSLPQGLDTFVGERGVRLSGGQRQRVGIARALYHDPAVLVLDEATSALDSAMEAEVMSAVRALRGFRAVLIVAHRLSTVGYCDRVYCLDHGRIAKEGAPDDLLVTEPS